MSTTTNNKKYLNQREAAEYLGLSKSTVSLLTSRGELTHYRIGRAVRYKRQDLDKYMESNKIAGTCGESRSEREVENGYL